MLDLRKILIIVIIGVLYVVLCFAVTSAIHEKPKYEDFCNAGTFEGKPYPILASPNCTVLMPNASLEALCAKEEGAYAEYRYDSNGCPVEEYCNRCMVGFNAENKIYNMYVFIVFSILGLVAIVIGLMMSPIPNELNKWIGSGFIAGGLAALFVGTSYYYSDMLRFYRPFVILVEIVVVIFVFYREMKMYSMMVAKGTGKENRKRKRR